MRHQFKILFYTKKNQPLRNGKLRIICRISIGGSSCTFSTHLSTEARLWDNRRERIRGGGETARQINSLLDNICYSLYDNYLKLLRSNDAISPQAIRGALLRDSGEGCGIISFFQQHNREFERMVGATRRPNTLYKYRYVCNHLQNFLLAVHNVSDIALSRVDRNLICDFHRWLISEMQCSVNTVKIYLTALKHILMLATAQGAIVQNPFLGYQLRGEPARRSFLLREELHLLAELQPHSPTEEIVLDAFLFSCFTGLSYIDIARLTKKDILQNGERWCITTQRTKTSTSVNVPLLQPPLKIFRKYYTHEHEQIFFGLPTNCWCNRVLRRLSLRAGITKPITFHTARHTFATTVTLSYGVPIEAVSRMLGHTDIKTTQIYAKVLESVVGSEMQRISPEIDADFE